MRSAVTPLLVASLTTVYAQIIVNPQNGTFDCQGSAAGQNFCAGPSLASPVIIRCDGTVDVIGNCDEDLAYVAPAGVKPFAPCYQPSPSGGAVCSYEGIGYPDNNGTPFNISNNGPITTVSWSSWSSWSSITAAISSTTSTTTSPAPSSATATTSTTTTSALTTSSTSPTATLPSTSTTPLAAVTSTTVISTASISTTIVFVYPTSSGASATIVSSIASSPNASPFQSAAAKKVGMWVPVALCMLGIIIM